MILRGGALLLTEAVTKFNSLVKCLGIFGDDVFIYGGGHDCPPRKINLRRWSKNKCLLKLIYGGPPPKMEAIFQGGPPKNPSQKEKDRCPRGSGEAISLISPSESHIAPPLPLHSPSGNASPSFSRASLSRPKPKRRHLSLPLLCLPLPSGSASPDLTAAAATPSPSLSRAPASADLEDRQALEP
jgi:hypothetical protein